MRRDELIDATTRLIQIFESTGVDALFRGGHDAAASDNDRTERKGRGASGNAVDVLRKFAVAAETFGPVEHRLLTLFDLDVILASGFWEATFTSGLQHPRLEKFRLDLHNFETFVPSIVAMLETDSDRMRAAPSFGMEVLTVILIEEQGKSSKPTRIIEAIDSVVRLYAVMGSLRGIEVDSLSIIGCDSGSDKSFDFLGAADAIKAVKDLILEIWDRAVFYRQTKTEHNITVALRSLGVVEEIARLETSGSLPHEDAERLKHQAVDAASSFLNCGLLIPEVANHTTYNPRVLMAPQPKLLTGAMESDREPGSVSDGDSQVNDQTRIPGSLREAGAASGLSEDELRILHKLMAKLDTTQR